MQMTRNITQEKLTTKGKQMQTNRTTRRRNHLQTSKIEKQKKEKRLQQYATKQTNHCQQDSMMTKQISTSIHPPQLNNGNKSNQHIVEQFGTINSREQN